MLPPGSDVAVARVKLAEETRRRVEKAAKDGGSKSRLGVRRGLCTVCPACTGFTKMTGLTHGSPHWHACACCGCSDHEHEEMK